MDQARRAARVPPLPASRPDWPIDSVKVRRDLDSERIALLSLQTMQYAGNIDMVEFAALSER